MSVGQLETRSVYHPAGSHIYESEPKCCSHLSVRRYSLCASIFVCIYVLSSVIHAGQSLCLICIFERIIIKIELNHTCKTFFQIRPRCVSAVCFYQLVQSVTSCCLFISNVTLSHFALCGPVSVLTSSHTETLSRSCGHFLWL